MVAQRSPTRVDERLRELFPASSTGGRIVRGLHLIEVAMEEIKAAQRRSPRKKKTIRDAFPVLYPGELLTYPDALYRAHCRELIGRCVRGEDVRPATDAELCIMFEQTSLKAPLASQFAHAYSTVFHRVFPSADRETFFTGSEAYANGTEEIIRDARKRLARDRGHR